MIDPLRIEDLAPEEIHDVLLADGNDLSEEETLALTEFIDRIGGIENAMAAVELLTEVEEAA